MIEILEQTPQLVLCVKPVGVRAQGEAEADLPALLKRQLAAIFTRSTGSIRPWGV